MGYAEEAMNELHGTDVFTGDRRVSSVVRRADPGNELERRGQQIADAMGRYRGTEPLVEAVGRLAKDYGQLLDAHTSFQASPLAEVEREVARARSIHAPMNGHHEGYAVLLEEVDELWELCKRNTHKFGTTDDREKQRALKRAAMREEAIQIAAMAIRFVQDVCETQPTATA